MIVSTLLVATSFPVVAAIAGELPSIVLTLVRFALAVLLFLPLVALRHRKEMLPDWRSLARYGLLSAPLVGFFLAMFEALRTTTAVNTGALYALVPIFAALIAYFLVGEKIQGRRAIALVAGMVGALWVVFRGDPARALEFDVSVGDALFLAGTVSLGLYVVLVKRMHRGEPMAVMTFWTLVTGTGWLLIFGWNDLTAARWDAVESRTMVAIGYLALFTTLITFLLTQNAVTVIGPTRTMAYSYLNPALVALLAWALGEAAIGWRAVPGVALTFVSMAILQRSAPGLADTGRYSAEAQAGIRRCAERSL